jgi:hypothetical protein
MLRRLLSVLLSAAWLAAPATGQAPGVHFVFTSDAHYGITRGTFRGRHDVNAHTVNQALVAAINTLPERRLPADGGVDAGTRIGEVDFVAEGGDIANREEGAGPDAIQRAADSWRQFSADYLDGLTLTDRSGRRSPVFIVPGNHDASNAVGFYKPMTPSIDKTAMVEIYNRMVHPDRPPTTATFEYSRDKVCFARDFGGVHFVYVQIWPDSSVRSWLDENLSRVATSTPVVLFAHDQPDSEAKHFGNPNGAHDINALDKFENLLVDEFADSRRSDVPAVTEQRAFEAFARRHPNLVAYFHGNSNWNQFYDWKGPDRTVALHVFRVDSPMKGAVSAKDETRLSFQVAAIDPGARRLTVRECLWNASPAVTSPTVTWGSTATVSLTR